MSRLRTLGSCHDLADQAMRELGSGAQRIGITPRPGAPAPPGESPVLEPLVPFTGKWYEHEVVRFPGPNSQWWVRDRGLNQPDMPENIYWEIVWGGEDKVSIQRNQPSEFPSPEEVFKEYGDFPVDE